ncbi:hypothetical protein [Bacillus sp. P14.5]|uniref:hypothetical protein n=1 Tax=Bacillus sp. P14.5 TaxID=1983400 RepID=UPI000DEA65C2|nr:hypothetical protein [Bacillus sp. P14.5]
MKKVITLLFLLLLSIILGCSISNEETIKDLPDEELLVKHWNNLSDKRKSSLIQVIHREESFHTNYDESMDKWIMLFDAGMRNTYYQDNDLKKAMLEFNRDREITEDSK